MSCASKWCIPLVAVTCAALGWAAGSGKLSFDRLVSAGDPPAPPCSKGSCCASGEGRATHFINAVADEPKDDKSTKKPNILFIMGDDIGMWNISAPHQGMMGYNTPNIDRLAKEGGMFLSYYAQQSCTAGRSAFITGQLPFRTGLSKVGLPGADLGLHKEDPTIAELLKPLGYMTGQFGKNHLGDKDEFLPTNHGFDEFLGNLYHLNAEEEPENPDYPKNPRFKKRFGPRGVIKATRDGKIEDTGPLTKKRMETIDEEVLGATVDFLGRAKKVGKPFFCWFNTTRMHNFTHVKKKNLGKTGLGFYADGMVEHDALIGKLLDKVDELGLKENTIVVYTTDNTLIMYIVGDNGASAEGGMDGTLNEIKGMNGLTVTIDEVYKNLDKLGGPESEPHYPVGWAWAGNTPFQWVKQVASHLGGTRNPLVVSWPAVIKHDPRPRDAFLHVVDVVPTILEAAKIPMPRTVNGFKQKPLAGKSFLASFTDPNFKGRPEQYFEVFSNRSIYANGWKANAQHTRPWRLYLAPGNWEKDRWELYNLKEDFSEANDLAKKMPDKLAAMKARFEQAARKHEIYPLDDRGSARIAVPKPPVPGADPDATTFTYYAGATRIAETAAPPMKNRSWTLTAKVQTEGEKTKGAIMAFGGVAAGIVLYMDKGVPIFDYNFFDEHTIVKGNKPVATGEATIEVVFDYQGKKPGGPAAITLKVNGKKVAESKMKATVPGRFGIDTFGVGEDSGQPVTFAYKPPFRFTGKIDKVVIEMK